MARPRMQRKHKQQASSSKGEGSPPKKQKMRGKDSEEENLEQGVKEENPIIPANLFKTSEEKEETMDTDENKERI